MGWRDRIARQIAREAQQISDLTAGAAKRGVTLDADVDRAGTYGLNWIERTTGPKGEGSNVVKELTDLADRNRRETWLSAIADDQPGGQGLVEFYRRHGFVPTGEETPHGPMMFRPPKALMVAPIGALAAPDQYEVPQ